MKFNLVLLVLSVVALIFAMTPEVESAGSFSCDCSCYRKAVSAYRSCRDGHKTKSYCKKTTGVHNCGSSYYSCSLNLCNGDADDSVSGHF